jgi:hypothetical protein
MVNELHCALRVALDTDYNGRFVPLNGTIPTLAGDVGCLGASLLAGAPPNAIIEVVEAVNALKDQVFHAVLGSASCSIGDNDSAAQAAYAVDGEDIDGGSGSGITQKGEWDAETLAPTGLSASQHVE